MVAQINKGQKLTLSSQALMKPEPLKIGVSWQLNSIKKDINVMTAPTIDISLGVFDRSKRLIDCVYYGKPSSSCGSISQEEHFLVEIDKKAARSDQKVLTLALDALPEEAMYGALIMHSYEGIDLKDCSMIQGHIYQGSLQEMEQHYAAFDAKGQQDLTGYSSLIMASIARDQCTWNFHMLSEPSKEARVNDIFDQFSERFIP